MCVLTDEAITQHDVYVASLAVSANVSF